MPADIEPVEPAVAPPVAPSVDNPPPAPAAPTPANLEQDRKEFMTAFVDNPRFTRGMNRDDKKRPEPPKSQEPEPTHIPAPPTAPPPPPEPGPEPEPEPQPEPTAAVDRAPVVIPKTTADPEPAPTPTADDEQARIDARVNERLRAAGIDPNDPALDRNDRPAHPEPRPALIDEHEAKVFAELARLNPNRYANIAAQVAEFREMEPQYRKRWMAENPGRPWNPDDEEHAAFYKQHEPQFAKRDFESATRAVERAEIVAQVREDVRREVEPELNQLRAERRMNQVAPVIERAAMEASALVLSAAPEFEKVMDNGKGGLVLSKDTDSKMQAINPALHLRASEVAEETMMVVAELEKMNQLGAAYPLNTAKKEQLPNGETIRPHMNIVNALDDLEEEYANAPAKDQVRNGKTFVTINERARMIAAIQQSDKLSPEAKRTKLQELNRTTWTVGPTEIKKRVIDEARGKIKSYSEKIKPVAAKAAAPKKGSPPPPPPAPKPAAAAPSSGSDTVTSSDVVDAGNPALRGGGGNQKSIADMLLR